MKIYTKANTKKELGQVGDCYVNYQGVIAYELHNGEIALQKVKADKKIPFHNCTIRKAHYEKLFLEAPHSNYTKASRALEITTPPKNIDEELEPSPLWKWLKELDD